MSLTYMCYQYEYEMKYLRSLNNWPDDPDSQPSFDVEKIWLMCGVGQTPRMAIMDALRYFIKKKENFISIFCQKTPTKYDHIKQAKFLGPHDREDTSGAYYVRVCDSGSAIPGDMSDHSREREKKAELQ